VSSEPGEGATFSIYIPGHERDATFVEPPKSEKEKPVPTELKPEKIEKSSAENNGNKGHLPSGPKPADPAGSFTQK